jgi:hypothetical protein
MIFLLAGLAGHDADEQLGDEIVTLMTLGQRQLSPDESMGTGERELWRWATERILVHDSLLWVEIHKK